MFAEEEWTDSPSPEGSSLSIKESSASPKKKAVGKQSLLRTLQTLASAPVWEVEEAVEDSNEEKDPSTTVKKPRKKRCKKRKRKSTVNNEGTQKEEEEAEIPAKKNKIMRKKPKRQTSSEVSEESKDRTAPLDIDQSQMEKNLSRQQWKNKMKNKRRCKNKYKQDKTGPKEKTSVQTQNPKVPKNNRITRKTKKIGAENGISSIKDNAVDISQEAGELKKTTKLSKTKKTGEENGLSTIACNSVNISHEVVEKEKSPKLTRKSQVRAEKLRRLLKFRSPADASKASEETEDVAVKGVEKQPPPQDPSTALRAKMEKQLEAARFRFINEKLYSSTSSEARRMFLQDPDAIAVYHKGYSAQVQHWPTNPVDSIISYICQKPATLVVADFGCGDCKIARSVRNKVHSFDLAPVCDLATACDMAKVPLRDSSVDIAVFCLSLMGTNLADFLTEANRVLVMGGVLKIAEVASRFENVHSFVRVLSNLGFKIVNKDTENSHFFSFEFKKTKKAPEKGMKFGLQLKPCLYKKR